jgi:hypothetical protein
MYRFGSEQAVREKVALAVKPYGALKNQVRQGISIPE